MIILALFLKPIAWYIAFKSATVESMNKMLLLAGGITVLLTLADKFSVASNLATPAILLTLLLYGLMSFILIPTAWKIKKAKLSIFINILGILGAFAGVNFTVDFIRGFLHFMNR